MMTGDTPELPKELFLTGRQRQIVKLLAEDFSAKEIGHLLNISSKTVEFHKERIRTTLGVKGLAGIVRFAIRTGLIEP